MAKSDSGSSPTMIVPRGTAITVDAHGQLSVAAPGNLVIQNSGSYGTLESRTGSIRIDKNVEVEAVEVRCAEACYVQGSLTAWKVTARSLHLEETAQAQVMLQETETLEVGRDARLVGNFGSDKELFLLFSRFARQVRSLPFYFERKGRPGELPGGEEDVVEAETVEEEPAAEPAERTVPVEPEADADEPEVAEEEEGEPPEEEAPEAAGARGPGEREELPESLFFALVLLERDLTRGGYGPTSRRVLEELVKLLDARDLAALRATHRTLFSRVLEPREDTRRAEELVGSYFAVPEPGVAEG